MAISRTAESVKIKSAPWNLTSFMNCLVLTPSCGISETPLGAYVSLACPRPWALRGP
jgi:hypothetical protein